MIERLLYGIAGMVVNSFVSVWSARAGGKLPRYTIRDYARDHDYGLIVGFMLLVITAFIGTLPVDWVTSVVPGGVYLTDLLNGDGGYKIKWLLYGAFIMDIARAGGKMLNKMR